MKQTEEQKERGVKTCSCCKEEKDIDKFGNNRSKPDNKASNCKQCAKERRDNREAIRKERKDRDQIKKDLLEKGLKECCRCNEVKKVEQFHKDKEKKDGLNRVCGLCRSKDKGYYYRNLERQKIAEENKALSDKGLKKCYECRNTKSIEQFNIRSQSNDGYENQCKECKYNYTSKYYRQNKEKLYKYRKAWAKANPDKRRLSTQRWDEKNKDLKSHYSRKRRALKMSALHPDHDRDIERELIKQANKLTEDTGTKHDVDHIFPLSQGGLHHHENMQILQANLNYQKHASLSWTHPDHKHLTDLPEWLQDECFARMFELMWDKKFNSDDDSEEDDTPQDEDNEDDYDFLLDLAG